jgi:hypothetical protein
MRAARAAAKHAKPGAVRMVERDAAFTSRRIGELELRIIRGEKGTTVGSDAPLGFTTIRDEAHILFDQKWLEA